MKTTTKQGRLAPITLMALVVLSTSYASLVSAADDKKNEAWRIEQRQKWAADIRGLNAESNARAKRNQEVQGLRLKSMQRSAIATAAGETWVEMGPSAMNMAGWSFGKVSGRNNAITPHPTDDNTVYFGAAAGGVWKTTNGGTSWTPVFDQVGTLPIGAITLDPSDPNRVWVGTGDKNQGCLGAYLGQGVSLSSDGGSTWVNKNGSGASAMTLSIVNSVALSTANTSQVLAGGFGECDANGSLANGGVFRSADGGASWTRVLNGKVEDIAFVPGTNTAFATVQGTGVYKSTNGGATWTNSSTGMTVASGRVRLAIAPSNNQVMYVLNGSKLFKTTNGGTSWTSVNTSACEGQCTYNQALAVHPTDPNKILVGSIRFAVSTNGGTSLSYLTANWGTGQKVHQDTHVLVWSKNNGNRFWVGSDGGIWRSDDGGSTYVNMNANLNVTQFYDVAVDFSSGDRMFGGAQDNSSSGRTTSSVWGLTYASGDGFMNAIDPSNPNVVLQTSYPNGYPSIVRSTTGGANNSFTDLSTTGITSSNNFPWVTPLATAGSKVWTASDTVYFGTTSATSFSWSKLTGNLGGPATVLAPKQNGSSYILYVGTEAGKVFYSSNAGTANASLTDVTGNLGSGRVSDIAIDPNNNSRVFVTRSFFSGSHLYRSTTGGNTWSAVGAGLPAVPAHTVAIDPLNTQRIFVGTDIGAYESNDGGDNFVPFNTGLPLGVIVQDLEISASPHVMVAATYARGAWKVTLGGSSNQAPVAGFNSSANLLAVNFTSTSTDADGTIASYAWNFGDNATSTAQNPSHTYAAAGSYNVALTVTDNQGATNTVTKSVTVTAANQAPVANFTSSISGLTVSFTDSSTDADGSIASRAWNFGDASTSTLQNPSHTYAAAGTYTVALTATDNGGATNSINKSVTVSASSCTGTVINASFSGASGQTQIQPGGSYYQSTVSGTHKACLVGPIGTDYDIYLDKWNGSTWTEVASGATEASSESITYSGTSGYYRYRVINYSGTGSYTLTYSKP
ncbi:MAG: PKD domain-containing protein [Burkholderiales bacterium]|nr:PKD domain-containing protein [Burkholderiales bacterium]